MGTLRKKFGWFGPLRYTACKRWFFNGSRLDIPVKRFPYGYRAKCPICGHWSLPILESGKGFLPGRCENGRCMVEGSMLE